MRSIRLSARFVSKTQISPGDYRDALVPGFALRVTPHGHRTYVLMARFPMSPKLYTRRALGDCRVITLEEARDKARHWLRLIAEGIDPQVEDARKRALRARQQVNTFESVARHYIDRHVSGLARVSETTRIIESEFISRWAMRPAAEILPDEVSAAIRDIAKTSPGRAFKAFAYIRGLYNWAISTHEFGLTANPVFGSRPSAIIGKRQELRERTLTNTELQAVWEAAGKLGYPYGALVQMLILTGQRLREVAEMKWSEVEGSLWTIPPARMKSRSTHEIPLAPNVIVLLGSLPRLRDSDYVFSTLNGLRPISGFSKMKARLDKLSGIRNWRLHDLRRTMRTHISTLPVEEKTRELVIAHAKRGLDRVYDQHGYRDEKRRCLVLSVVHVGLG
jgi:integrase